MSGSRVLLTRLRHLQHHHHPNSQTRLLPHSPVTRAVPPLPQPLSSLSVGVRACSSFKSSISLDKLYPESTLSYTRIPNPPENKPDKFSGYIPMEKLEITFSRSSGPGGQNVNKLNTKANVKFKVSEADWIPELVRKSFIEKFKNQVTKEGYLMVNSDRTRYQHHNTADAIQKLREMIRSCEPGEVQTPTAETLERLRRNREKAARERLLLKRSRSQVKSHRGAV